jgi:phosphoribosylformylglycinamidine synthase
VRRERAEGGVAIDALSSLDWGRWDSAEREKKLTELAIQLGRKLDLSELKALLEQWNTPEVFKFRSTLGLPRHPTLTELQVVAEAWSEEARQAVLTAPFVALGDEGSAQASGLVSATLGATVQQVPKSWIISAGDQRPAVLALDEQTWVSFGIRQSGSRPGRAVEQAALQSLLGGQRETWGAERPALPLAQSFFQVLPEQMNEESTLSLTRAIELATTRTQVPVLAGAEGLANAAQESPLMAGATLGVVIRKDREPIRIGDRLLSITWAGKTQESREDPVFQRQLQDLLVELEALQWVSAIRAGASGSTLVTALRMATEAGGLQVEAAEILGQRDRVLLAVSPERLKEVERKLLASRIEFQVVGEFTDSGRLLLTRSKVPVGDFALSFLWNGPEQHAISFDPEAMSSTANYSPPDRLPFSQHGATLLKAVLAQPGIRSPERLVAASDFEAQGNAELKPLNRGNLGTPGVSYGPNDATVLLVGQQSFKASGFLEGHVHEMALGLGICQRQGISDPRWQAESAVDEAARNVVASGALLGHPDVVGGLSVQWFGPPVQQDPRAAAHLFAALEGVRDAALALELPVLTASTTFSRELTCGFAVCHALGRLRSRRRAQSADFKFSGDLIYLLGPEVECLGGSRFADLFGCTPELSVLPEPQWSLARLIYSWLGGVLGKEKYRVRSVHDVSDGGLLVAVTECSLARGLGAYLRLPEGVDPEAWAFGEGFHRFVVSSSDPDSTYLEAEWSALGIPYQRIGVVTSSDRLEMGGAWSVPLQELRRAWTQKGTSR